jgi:hypothetical protein
VLSEIALTAPVRRDLKDGGELAIEVAAGFAKFLS